jgi:hypothetical protein
MIMGQSGPYLAKTTHDHGRRPNPDLRHLRAMLKLLAFVLPLGLDSFAVAAAIGTSLVAQRLVAG